MEQNKDSDTINIMIATDIHLGYMEKDAIRGEDSFETFEEILQHAVNNKVDMILLAGDLFHLNKPSRYSINKSIALLRKYTLGDKKPEIDIFSDESVNFAHCQFPRANFKDPSLGIAIPVFSIHGNHDDPIGSQSLCSLDILSSAGLVNYFGKHNKVEEFDVVPVVIGKGSTRLAMYGIGSVRDERLHRTFRNKMVRFSRPPNDDEFFNILLLHQNRAQNTPSDHIPENFIEPFFDLVFWGHEHECLIEPTPSQSGNFHIIQPGSSVATSLCPAEAVKKHVGILKIKGKSFDLQKIELKTVRPFIFSEIDIDDLKDRARVTINEKSFYQYLTRKVHEQLSIFSNLEPENDKIPLIRLRVHHSSNSIKSLDRNAFGSQFRGMVANPKEIVLIKKKPSKRIASLLDFDTESNDQRIKEICDQLEEIKMEDIIQQYLEENESTMKLQVLSLEEMSEAVRKFVEKDDLDVIFQQVNTTISRIKSNLEFPLNEAEIEHSINVARNKAGLNSQSIESQFSLDDEFDKIPIFPSETSADKPKPAKRQTKTKKEALDKHDFENSEIPDNDLHMTQTCKKRAVPTRRVKASTVRVESSEDSSDEDIDDFKYKDSVSDDLITFQQKKKITGKKKRTDYF